jgi:hypothetical protein
MSLVPRKQILEIPAEYVDAANDSLKWLIVLVISFAYNQYFGQRYGVAGLAGGPLNLTLKTAGLTALGFFVYHFVIQRVVVFMPKSGQSTYYMALKRSS